MLTTDPASASASRKLNGLGFSIWETWSSRPLPGGGMPDALPASVEPDLSAATGKFPRRVERMHRGRNEWQ